MANAEKHERYGKCLLERVIGRGARATVYLAWHEGLQIPVAVKVMKRTAGAQEAQHTERFVREARIAAQLSHPNIVRVYDCGEKGDYYYLVLEYIEGENCRDKLDQWGTFDWQRAVQIVRQAAAALGYAAGKGIIHRDLKPENIMIDTEGQVRIADLGLAKEVVTHGTSATLDGDVLGTPYYMSPEQVRQPSEVDFRADIYSLGATLYHMVVGETPFEASTPFEIMAKHINEPLPSPRDKRPQLPEALCRIVARCMAKDPADRYQSYDALVDDLDEVMARKGGGEVARRPAADSGLDDEAEPAAAGAGAEPDGGSRRGAVRHVELPANVQQVRARLYGLTALLCYGGFLVSLHQFVGFLWGPLAGVAATVTLLALSAGAAYVALFAGAAAEHSDLSAPLVDRLQAVIKRLSQRLEMPAPRLHLCRRGEETAFSFRLMGRWASLHLPGPWLERTDLTPDEREAFVAEAMAPLYSGDAEVRTLLAVPVGLLHGGRRLGSGLAGWLLSHRKRRGRQVLQAVSLGSLVLLCTASALLFLHSLWAGVMGVAFATSLLMTAAFERQSRYAADLFAAKVANGEEFVQSLSVVRGLNSADRWELTRVGLGDSMATRSGDAVPSGERRELVDTVVGHYREVEHTPDTLGLAGLVFSMVPPAAERLNRLAGVGRTGRALRTVLLHIARLYRGLLGRDTQETLTLRDLGAGRFHVAAGAGAGLLTVLLMGLFYLRGAAGYVSFLGTVCILGLVLGCLNGSHTGQRPLSAGRLGWSTTVSAMAYTLVSMLGFCLVGALPLSRFALQFPVQLILSLAVAANAAALFVRLSTVPPTAERSSPDAAAGEQSVAGPEAMGADGPPQDLLGGREPAQDVMTPEFSPEAEAQPVE